MPKKQKNWTTSVRLKGFGLSSHSRRVFSLCHLMVVDPDPPVRLQHQEKIWSLSPGAVFPFSSVIRGICSETRQPSTRKCLFRWQVNDCQLPPSLKISRICWWNVNARPSFLLLQPTILSTSTRISRRRRNTFQLGPFNRWPEKCRVFLWFIVPTGWGESIFGCHNSQSIISGEQPAIQSGIVW